MKRAVQSLLLGLVGLVAFSAFAQEQSIRHERRPAIGTEGTSTSSQPQPAYDYFSILDGMPMAFVLHHDTEVGTGNPIDVYMLAIELQVMNSDGNLEPEGLIIDNFFTAKAVKPKTAPNPHNARDCKTWNGLVLGEMNHRPKGSYTWSYIEFTVAKGARVIQTNEDGAVWYSDDVECWGSRDRFKPF